MRMWTSTAIAVLVAACTHHTPVLDVGVLSDGLDAFLAAHPLATGQNIRADEVGRTATASYHVVQVADRETPHVHAMHDLTVLVLRGEGTLRRDAGTVRLQAGDVVVVPRDRVHWFARDGAEPAIALVTFTPPLDAPDNVPVDSDGARR
ncbi:MAG TPA: cupin domain-containing protein [Candidatus Binatia bacterium]|jgi:quercetin dioxygenase-like cupin family protein|nr:cupin domain-containing protein [Candidatus Binatia bacterium]